MFHVFYDYVASEGEAMRICFIFASKYSERVNLVFHGSPLGGALFQLMFSSSLAEQPYGVLEYCYSWSKLVFLLWLIAKIIQGQFVF